MFINKIYDVAIYFCNCYCLVVEFSTLKLKNYVLEKINKCTDCKCATERIIIHYTDTEVRIKARRVVYNTKSKGIN